MTIDELIKKHREKKGFSEEYVAQQLGMTMGEYMDVEVHSDEAVILLTFETANRLFSILEINWDDAIKSVVQNEKNIDLEYPKELNLEEMLHFLESDLGVPSERINCELKLSSEQMVKIRTQLGLNTKGVRHK
jgi:transcriptional regulator with XRE-family HTH domain